MGILDRFKRNGAAHITNEQMQAIRPLLDSKAGRIDEQDLVLDAGALPEPLSHDGQQHPAIIVRPQGECRPGQIPALVWYSGDHTCAMSFEADPGLVFLRITTFKDGMRLVGEARGRTGQNGVKLEGDAVALEEFALHGPAVLASAIEAAHTLDQSVDMPGAPDGPARPILDSSLGNLPSQGEVNHSFDH